MKLRRNSVLALGLLGASVMACGSDPGPGPKTPHGPKDAKGQPIAQEAANRFKKALAELRKHDQANDWTDASCAATAKLFEEAAAEQKDEMDKTFFEARYNAGVAYQRCKQEAQAKKLFSAILSSNPQYHRARVQMALYDFKASGDVEKAVMEMERAIKDAEFKNVEALVQLAYLQMHRQSTSEGDDCPDDLCRAKKNLQRALAINDGYMPAFNQLAILYLEMAKKKAGRGRRRVSAAVEARKRVDTQALELAALVCSQALRKNPRYAPVHNTSGLISAELGDLSQAAVSFGLARKLDVKFFEAHMNYAAVNLQFRGFQKAEAAYRDALKLKDDYEARLGLALAIRGQLQDPFDKRIAQVESELAAAKKLDPERPETYYNEAIFVQEFKARTKQGKAAEPILLQAKGLFETFIQKAGGEEVFAEAVKRAKERVEDIDTMIAFEREEAKRQKELEEMRRRREAEEQLKKDKK